MFGDDDVTSRPNTNNEEANLPVILGGSHYALMALAAYTVYGYHNDLSTLSLLLTALTMYISFFATATDIDQVGRDKVADFYLRAGKFFTITAFISACVAIVRMKIYVQ